MLSTTVLDSLSARIAVVDDAGRVVCCNRAWRSAPGLLGSLVGGEAEQPSQRVQADLLDDLRRATTHGSAVASHLLFGIGAVLAGARELFAMELVDGGAPDARHFELTVEALRSRAGGAIVTLRDVTARARAAADARQRLDEVAHLARVASVAGLTTSLAHELRQPLTAIRANASAGLRLLAGDAPDLPTVRAIMQDITAAVVHAAGVIDGLRALLRRGATLHDTIDANATVHAAVRLIAADAAARHTPVALQLQAGLPPISGDAVQLQQVVLNLVLNALDATDRVPLAARRVTVTTMCTEPTWVTIAVGDTGPGLPEGDVFESFFTTKPTGLGMGLPVARSIVEAHGGRIWAESGGACGALFHVRLPAAQDDPGSPGPGARPPLAQGPISSAG